MLLDEHLVVGQLEDPRGGPYLCVSTFWANPITAENLHEGPAHERDNNHRQPGWHLGESPEEVSERDSQAVLLKGSIERVPVALVRRSLLVLVVDEEGLEGLGRGRSAVQGKEADGSSRSGLVGQGLGDLEVVQRRRADGPRVAEDLFLVAIDHGELGRVWLGSQKREGVLS